MLRILLVAGTLSVWGLDLAFEGYRQRQCRHEIQDLREEIELTRYRFEISRLHFQATARQCIQNPEIPRTAHVARPWGPNGLGRPETRLTATIVAVAEGDRDGR